MALGSLAAWVAVRICCRRNAFTYAVGYPALIFFALAWCHLSSGRETGHWFVKSMLSLYVRVMARDVVAMVCSHKLKTYK